MKESLCSHVIRSTSFVNISSAALLLDSVDNFQTLLRQFRVPLTEFHILAHCGQGRLMLPSSDGGPSDIRP
jgi:hypothetical protein